VQDYRLAPVPRNSDYKKNPQGFAEIICTNQTPERPN